MKAYKLEILIIDFERLGKAGIVEELANANQRFPNDCINMRIMDIKEMDIGEWSDGHPLNGHNAEAEYHRIFP